jgi:hypothetical protein
MTDTAPWEVLVKNSLMNCLQEHAAELGICYVCHAKTLVKNLACEDIEFRQCSKCFLIYCLTPNMPQKTKIPRDQDNQ